jgi:hypothetical protein
VQDEADGVDGLDTLAANSGGGQGAATGDKREYPVSGNATRDQVRKIIFESFSGDKQVMNEALSIGQVVESIENDIFGIIWYNNMNR